MPIELEQLEVWLFRFRPLFEYQDYVKSRDWEIFVAKQIELLSDHKLKCVFTGLGAGDAIKVEDWEYDPKRPLDITVLRDNKEIAVVEVQADYKYTYDRSKFFPIQEHKIFQAMQKPLPHYFVYILTLEDTCYWLKSEKIAKYEAVDLGTYVKGEYVIQRQHPVRKDVWMKGLSSLVQRLLRVKYD